MSSMETVVAAANAIASAESRVHVHVQPAFVQRRRWKTWLHNFCCFRSHHHQNRISKSVLVPEPTEIPFSPTLANSNQSSGLMVAPPSSPSSFLQSDPPSTNQSPSKFLSLSSLTAHSYSPRASSIFAVGPYADDTKLVSPPVFSTFTTEPSTAPVTPPELMQQTTPCSSPEVPFARLLSSSFKSDGEISFSESANNSTVGDFSGRCRIFNGRIVRDNGSILDGRITAVQAKSTVEIEDISFEFMAQEEFGQGVKKNEASCEDLTSLFHEMDERDQVLEKKRHFSEIETSREFKFNVEAENGDDEELGVVSTGSGWSQIKFGFAERNN